MATRKKIGQVTPEEKNEIQQLFERRNGLNELAKILTADNAELYEKLVKDLGETGTKFQSWWDRMGAKYQWESIEGAPILSSSLAIFYHQREATPKLQ